MPGDLGDSDPLPALRVRTLAPAPLPQAQQAWHLGETGLEAPLAGGLGNHAGGMLKLLVAQRAGGQGGIRPRRTL